MSQAKYASADAVRSTGARIVAGRAFAQASDGGYKMPAHRYPAFVSGYISWNEDF